MKHLPIYVNLSSKHVVVSGAGQTAVAKLRRLLRTEAQISVFGTNPNKEICEWANVGYLNHFERRAEIEDIRHATLVYCANSDAKENTRIADIGCKLNVLVNIVDNLEDSTFISPAIVDRDPVSVAIGTEGSAPVLARMIKADLEERLPQQIGLQAQVGKKLRSEVNSVLDGKNRRQFWHEFYSQMESRTFSRDEEFHARELLHNFIESRLMHDSPSSGLVSLVGAGPGDFELLTLKARKRLYDADVVIHDRLVPTQILEIARTEATIINVGKVGFGPSVNQADINSIMVEHAQSGYHVVRLKSGDPAIFGRLDEEIDALEVAGIRWEIIPGITAASAAAASIGVSITKRKRNSKVRIITAHDAHGFAEQDWVELAKSGAVTAIYMGKRAAKFLQLRLLMHGASNSTLVTIVENASLPQQRVISTTLRYLPDVIENSRILGPIIIFIGLATRDAAEVTESDTTMELNVV